MFEKQQALIDNILRKEHLLEQFLEKMKQNSGFDSDDETTIIEKMNQLQAVRMMTEDQLKKHKEIHDNYVVKIKHQVQEREKVLQEEKQLFTEFPDLLEFFAQKQIVVKENLKTLEQLLQM